MRLEDLKLDPEFEKLLRQQNEDEAKEMAASIAAHGYLSPLICWDGKDVIIDGHHRYAHWKAAFDAWQDSHAQWRKAHAAWIAQRPGAIARTLGSKETEEPKEPDEPERPDLLSMKFEDRESVKAFIAEHQAARRNMSEFELSVIRGRQFHAERDSGATYQASAVKVAAEHGVSPATVIRDAALAESVDELKEDDPEIEGKCASDDGPSRSQIVTAGSLRKSMKEIAKATGRTLDQVLDDTTAPDGRTMRQVLDGLTTPKRHRVDAGEASVKAPKWEAVIVKFEREFRTVVADLWQDGDKEIRAAVKARFNEMVCCVFPGKKPPIKHTIMGEQVVAGKAVAS